MVGLSKKIFIRVDKCLLFENKTTQRSSLTMHEKKLLFYTNTS